MNFAEIEALRPFMTPAERAEFDSLLAGFTPPVWVPLPGPQTMAYESLADITGYGGAAGGGKTDLGCGLALTEHHKVLVLRREATQLTGIIDRFTELIGHRTGFNGTDKIWRLPERQIEFGSTPNADDWNKYQGRPHDLVIVEEAANFLEIQVRALLGWLRTVVKGQRCRALLTFNPPTNAEGRWIIEYFAPWLDKKHPHYPAPAGQIRYFATIAGKDIEVPDREPFVLVGSARIYDFDPADHKPDDIVVPMSRTFIPSRVSDNPYLTGTGYMSTLQSMPEPLRSQMLYGDFQAGIEDDAMQVIPTAWVDAAMARWAEPDVKPPMDSIGVDVARGGRDNTVIARRHGMWFDKPIVKPGLATPDGPTVAGFAIAALRDSAPIHIDIIGVGSSPYDFLNQTGIQVLGINVSEKAIGMDRSGRLRFFNQRSELWWRMREALDPIANNGIALPPDKQLAADLCAPCWELRGSTIKVESREEIYDRIKRSPDWASAYVLALMETPKVHDLHRSHTSSRREHNPYDFELPRAKRADHNPYG